MTVAIRSAVLTEDRDLLIDTLFRFLTPLSGKRRFNWLYEDNPHGQAHVWLAVDQRNKTVVGMASAFPRRVYINGQAEMSWVLGDFCINPQYRSLGPALQLQRACLAAAEAEGLAFCYDFPSKTMTAVYKRLGISASYNMLRLARPLRTDRKVRQLVKLPLAARGLSLIGNLVLSFGNHTLQTENGLSIGAHHGRCGEEFTVLAGRTRAQQGISIKHSAEYLNWRYVENPLCEYELLTARRESTLLGCAVFLEEREDAMLVDLFGVQEETVLSALIGHGVRLMADRGVQTLSAPICQAHPWLGLLERQGFRTREVRPLVICAPSDIAPRNGIFKEQNCFFLHGDRDS